MAIRKIARMGHEVLRRVSEPIADPTAPEIARLAQDLIDTCEDIEKLKELTKQIITSQENEKAFAREAMLQLKKEMDFAVSKKFGFR